MQIYLSNTSELFFFLFKRLSHKKKLTVGARFTTNKRVPSCSISTTVNSNSLCFIFPFSYTNRFINEYVLHQTFPLMQQELATRFALLIIPVSPIAMPESRWSTEIIGLESMRIKTSALEKSSSLITGKTLNLVVLASFPKVIAMRRLNRYGPLDQLTFVGLERQAALLPKED